MAKNYGIDKLERNRLIQEKIAKIKYSLHKHSRSINIKEISKINYNKLVKGENEKISVPKGITVNPTNIIIYDLISKSELSHFIKSWNRLSKKCPNTNLTVQPSEQDIISYIKDLHNNLSKRSWCYVGTFTVSRYIDVAKYFQLYIYNFSVSLCMLKFDVRLSKLFHIKVKKLFTNKCGNPLLKTSRTYLGHRKIQNVSLNVSIDSVKNRSWHELISKLKWRFLKFISKALKLKFLFFSKNIQSPSILMISEPVEQLLLMYPSGKSDYIRHFQKYKEYLYFISAIDFYDSFSIGNNQRMYVNTRPNYNIQYFYDSRKVKFNVKFNDKINNLFDVISKLLCLNISNDMRRKYTYNYVTSTDSIKMKWRKYKKILKSQFNYLNNMSLFNIIKDEIEWKSLIDRFKVYHNNSKLIIYFLNILRTANTLDNLINKENGYVNDKITLLKNLSEQKQNHKGLILFITISAFIVSFLALISSLGSLNSTILKSNIVSICGFVEKVIHVLFVYI